MGDFKTNNAWLRIEKHEENEIECFSKKYMDFLDVSKTERMCVKEIVKQAKKGGFLDLNHIISSGNQIKSGMKIYAEYKNKAAALFIIGEKPIEEGFKLVGAHIDSPRIDLNYYGGIKKYQWATTPLSMYGTLYTSNNEKIEISIGDNDGDPVFFINDLSTSLSKKA